MSTKINQKEYLKKYLSGDKKKKKKDKKIKTKATVKIIDDDMHVNNDLQIDEELLLTGEDAPQIVGIVDTSGQPVESKWKSFNAIKKEENLDDDLWGKKAETITNLREDLSPKRQKSPKSRQLLPTRRDSDQSPPRIAPTKRIHINGNNLHSEKPSRDRDQSPPRKASFARPRRDSDQSPPRKRSPARSRRNSDQSPPRRVSKTSRKDSDQSPRRRRSPDRKRIDQSPRRRQSPSKKRRNSDQSPPRRKTAGQSSPSRFDNSSAIRIKKENSPDQSPPRRGERENPFKKSIKLENPSPDSSPRNRRRSDSPPPTHKPSSSKMTKTLDGKRAGLQDAQTLRVETEERRRNEDKMYSKMSKEVSGRDAEVQIRKSSYRRHRKYVEEDPEVQRQKAEHEEKKKVLYSRWNKGVKQIEAFQAKISDDQYESSKPLARYSNDADLDEMLKQKEREDDPMLEYIRSKKKDQQLAKNVPVMPKYKGSYPENRFGIPPGYRWDGVDRSNGYEKKWFDVQSSKQAVAEEAYKYSVEDM
ncbi:BUD13 homolog [Episyrphus balteatus]|uniref:BUD13 homolog n=1 Tax=Episyrphus balteatus TaxID=286459 RepID=UPI002485CD2F|nr:BUD13 homolog [Episyrphus balteatus]